MNHRAVRFEVSVADIDPFSYKDCPAFISFPQSGGRRQRRQRRTALRLPRTGGVGHLHRQLVGKPVARVLLARRSR
jgi:hypothetical protein